MSGHKNSNHLVTLTILCLVTAALIFSYRCLANHNKNKEPKEEENKTQEDTSIQVVDEDETAFTSLAIQKQDTNILLTKKDALWILYGEESFPVDNSKANDLASTLATLTSPRVVVEEAENLSDYGLDHPSIVITGKKKDGGEVKLSIGDQLSVDSSYYGCMGDDKKVYVINLATESKFDLEKDNLFIMPETTTLDTSKMREVQLSSTLYPSFHVSYDEENPYDFTTTGAYAWYSVEPNRDPINIDMTKFNELLTKFSDLSVMKGVAYGEDALKEYGLDAPLTMIYIKYLDTEDKEKELVLHIGKSDENGNFYVTENDLKIVYLMSSSVMSEKLNVAVSDYYSRYMHMIAISNVTQFKITANAASYVFDVKVEQSLDDNGNETTQTTYYKNGTAYEKVEDFSNFYQKFISLQTKDFLTNEDVVDGEKVMTISFDLNDGTNILVEYYEYNQDSYAVAINGKPEYTTEKDAVNEFMQSLK